MQEPLRSQYLAALGIENYVPRFILPGAKLSEPCEWFEAPADTVDATIDARAPSEPSRNTENNRDIINTEKTADSAIQRAPIIETPVARPVRINEIIDTKVPVAPAAAVPQFALSIVLAAGGILLIDAAPASSAERSAYQKLLSNMLPALRPAAAQYVLDIFIWPLTRQPKISRDADAAKETLAAYLHKQIQQRAIDTVLLLGDAAQQWSTFNDADVRVIKSTSLLACVQDPALKRSLWSDIRHIAER